MAFSDSKNFANGCETYPLQASTRILYIGHDRFFFSSFHFKISFGCVSFQISIAASPLNCPRIDQVSPGVEIWICTARYSGGTCPRLPPVLAKDFCVFTMLTATHEHVITSTTASLYIHIQWPLLSVLQFYYTLHKIKNKLYGVDTSTKQASYVNVILLYS